MKPHSRHEHVRHPTAIIIHNHRGIEVLDVNTGRPLTHLDLQTSGRPSTFVDVNEDDTIEEVRANFMLKCQAEVSTIQPRPRAIFVGPLCESPFWWGGVSLMNLFYTPEGVSEDTHLAVAPVVVKRCVFVYTFLCIPGIYFYVCIRLYVGVHVCIRMYVSIRVYVCICMYMHMCMLV